ncbi:MAG: hypothetical protein ACYTA5_16150 [Planctomycetota bacterium]
MFLNPPLSPLCKGGCESKPPADTQPKVDQEVLLRFKPQVGQTYRHRYSVNLDKTTFDKPRNEELDATISLSILGKEAENYRAGIDVQLGDSNLGKNARAMMEDKAKIAESRKVVISDRYVFDHQGTQNLCFPTEAVKSGSIWTGDCLFTFGDMGAVDPPMLVTSYRLVDLEQSKDGQYCTIECQPVRKQSEVPFQLGKLGIQCNAEGRVTAIEQGSGAEGKIKVGDLLVGLQGNKASTAAKRNQLYERFVEPPENIGSDIPVTIIRDGREQTIKVTSSMATMGNMRINISKALRKVLFAVDKGIICSEKTTCELAVTYHFVKDLPFVDDYTGTKSIEKLATKKMPPRIYKYVWKTDLMDD